MNDLEYIVSRTTEEAALRQIAEEAAELAQAALKLCRVIKKDSPTPTPEGTARGHVVEEIADVLLSMNVWDTMCGIDYPYNDIMDAKRKRWVDRIKSKEGEENAEEDKFKT